MIFSVETVLSTFCQVLGVEVLMAWLELISREKLVEDVKLVIQPI